MTSSTRGSTRVVEWLSRYTGRFTTAPIVPGNLFPPACPPPRPWLYGWGESRTGPRARSEDEPEGLDEQPRDHGVVHGPGRPARVREGAGRALPAHGATRGPGRDPGRAAPRTDL